MARGRPKKVSANPFKPQDEAKHLSWEHGHTAQSMDENPYTKDDGEVYTVWLQGFRANKSRPKVEAKQVPDEAEIDSGSLKVVTRTDGTGSLESLPTDLLELELKKRKLKELEQLMLQQQKLLQALEENKHKVARLQILMGD